MRKTVAAATMAASLTIGGAAGVALFTPTLSGAQTDETTDTETSDAEPGSHLAEILAPLVEDGTITQAQADAVVAAMLDARPMHRHGLGFRGDIAEAVTDVLGLDAAEIRDRLADGRSLADIAEAEGVDPQALVDAIVAERQERLDAAVDAGRLTEEQAAERTDHFAEHAADMVERTPMLDGEGPHGTGRGMGRHGAGQGFGSMGMGTMSPGPAGTTAS